MGLIRLLLAFAVLVDHSTPLWGCRFLGGELSVQCFFAISGFYMAMILEGPYMRQIPAFFKNRFLRIFPMYWVVLAISALSSSALWIATSGSHPGTLFAWRAHGLDLGAGPSLLLAISIPLLLFQDTTLFLGVDPATRALLPVLDFRNTPIPMVAFLPVPPSWSLSLELYFYLLAPWVARWRLRWIAVLTGLSLGLRFAMGLRGLDFDPWSYRFFPTSICFFLFGVMAWKLGRRFNVDRAPRALATTVWLGMLATMLGWKEVGEIGTLILVASLAGSLPVIFSLTRVWKWDRWFGDLSFPLYLIHWEVFAITPRLPTPLRFLAALLAAAALQHFVGSRVDRWRSHPRAG